MRNSEHYPDPTAGIAIRNIEDERVRKVIRQVKVILQQNDIELLNRIQVKDKRTGRIYK